MTEVSKYRGSWPKAYPADSCICSVSMSAPSRKSCSVVHREFCSKLSATSMKPNPTYLIHHQREIRLVVKR